MVAFVVCFVDDRSIYATVFFVLFCLSQVMLSYSEFVAPPLYNAQT